MPTRTTILPPKLLSDVSSQPEVGGALAAVSGKFMALLGVAAVAGAAFMIPGRKELARRMVQDGNSARVLEMVQQASDPEDLQQMKTAALEALREHGETTSETSPAQGIARDPVAALGHLLALSKEPHWADSSRSNLSILAARVPTASQALEMLEPVAEALPAPDCLAVYCVMAERSLAAGDPGKASDWYRRAAQRSPLPWEMVSQQIVSCRYSERSAEALAVLENYLKSTSGKPLPDSTADLQVDLLRDSGRSAEAFDLLRPRFQSCQDASQRGLLFGKLMECAEESDRGKELLVLAIPFMKADPAWNIAPQNLVGNTAGHEAFLNRCQLLGPLAEWNEEPEAALEFHFRAAAAGDVAAVLRADELSGDLLADAEWYQVLKCITPIKDHPEFEMRVAQMAGEGSDYVEAERRYQSWLGAHPSDSRAWYELSNVWEEAGNLPEAAESMKRAVALEPAKVDWIVELASLEIALKQVPEAVALYNALPLESHTPQTLENFSLAAEAAGDATALNKAWLTLCERFPAKRTPDAYLRLAESFSHLGTENFAEKALREGVAALPQSQSLKIALSGKLNDMDRPIQAAEILTDASLQGNLQAGELWLALMSGRPATPDMLEHAAKLMAMSGNLEMPAKTRLATILEDGNQFELAENVLGPAAKTSGHWHELARTKYDGGDLEATVSCERQYLALVTEPPASEWTFLGDVLGELGHLDEAKEAYEKAAHTLISKAPMAAVVPPDPRVSSIH